MLDLAEIIKSHPGCVNTRSQLLALLRDLYHTEKRSVNLVMIAYDSGIAGRIAGLKAVSSDQYQRFAAQLINDYGLQEQYANEAIEIWAKAYSLSYHRGTTTQLAKTQASSASLNYNPDAYAKVGEVVSGSASEYVLEPSGNTVVLSKFRGFDDPDTVIPNCINGKKVVGIGPDAFRGCKNIKTLLIPDGIRFIEGGAFAECSNLRKVVFPATLKRIGSDYFSGSSASGAFEGCLIESMILPPSLEVIGVNTFLGCTKLVKVVLPEQLKRINETAFFGCKTLNEIQFPLSLQQIGMHAFYGCESLSVLVLNEGLREIDQGAFGGCISLQKVLIPRTLNKVDYSSPTLNDIFESHLLGKPMNLTIYCYPGTFGLKYAREIGYPIKNAWEFQND